jgi:hypothetical protein
MGKHSASDPQGINKLFVPGYLIDSVGYYMRKYRVVYELGINSQVA